jgi:hypothetical protein
MTIEVFKTNVRDERQAEELKAVLLSHFPGSRVNFDLDDHDRVLRLEGPDLKAEKVMVLANEKGIACNILE